MSTALECPFVHLPDGKTVEEVFERSLNAAIRDIEGHPLGKIFQRLIKYGPSNPDKPKVLEGDNKTTLSDPECERCVEFIYSHMINRFKGELAELLALEPCVSLIRRLQHERHLSLNVHLYWGDMVQERRQNRKAIAEYNTGWNDFVKGADGLVVEQISRQDFNPQNLLRIHGIIEVKSMARPTN
ncbi:MAG: hypothetical protein QXV17_07150 [Candidatus Micrarchaeaceae archaeon]